MKEQLTALYELQGLDVRIGQIQARISAMTGGKDLKAKLGIGRPQLEAAEKALAKTEADLKDSELQLKSIEEKAAGYQKRLASGSNPKELAAIEKEIAVLREQQGKLDGRTLELYDQVEAARGKVENLKKIIAQIESRLESTVSQESAERESLDAEMAELTKKRAAVAAKVSDRMLLSRYEAVRKRTGSTGIARVIDSKCEGCHVSLTTFMVRKLYNPTEMLNCESCGRILFIADE